MGGLGGHNSLGAFPQGQQQHTHPNHLGPSWANSDTYYEGRPGQRQPSYVGMGPVYGQPPSSPPQQPPPPGGGSSSVTGSDILDAGNQEPKLDKSNILLLGKCTENKCYADFLLIILLISQRDYFKI